MLQYVWNLSPHWNVQSVSRFHVFKFFPFPVKVLVVLDRFIVFEVFEGWNFLYTYSGAFNISRFFFDIFQPRSPVLQPAPQSRTHITKIQKKKMMMGTSLLGVFYPEDFLFGSFW